MTHLRAAALLFVAVFGALVASVAVGRQYRNAEGNTVSQGVVIESGDAAVTFDNPFPTLSMPFQRAGDPFIFPATATPTQYVVTQPPGTRSYRAINPCLNADIRVKTVAATAPVVSEATAYPGVRRVTSAADSVTAATGTRFMGRYGETLASTFNPLGGGQRVISIMIVPVPGSTVDVSGFTCPFELGYGMGG